MDSNAQTAYLLFLTDWQMIGATAIWGNSLYTIVDGPSWTLAEANAVALGGHLATISSLAEDIFLQKMFRDEVGTGYTPNSNFRNDGFWIGLNDEENEGTWVWSSGETTLYRNANTDYSDAWGGQDYIVLLPLNEGDIDGTWYWDSQNPHSSGYDMTEHRGIAEIPLSLYIDTPASPKEGAGEFTVTIDLSAGTVAEYKYSLATGAQVWYVVSGITQEDLEDGYFLSGTGTINALGNIVLDGATTSGIKFALKDDGIAETEEFKITFYTANPSTTTEVLGDIQLGAAESTTITDTGVPLKIREFTSDDSTICISGTAGLTSPSKIESVSFIQSITGTGKNRVTTLTPNYTLLVTYSNPGLDGITFNGGSAANTISAAGVAGDYSRPAFNGQTILNGEFGTDSITGGYYRNWLVGGGIFSTPLSTATTAVDTLIGTAGAMDVFDLRTSDFTSDAYSALNSGSARINNYTLGEDWIVLAGAQGSYSFTAVQTTTGSKRNKITTTTGYQIFNGSELVATVNAASGTTLTGNAATDLQILYGQTGDPTDTSFGGQQMFF